MIFAAIVMMAGFTTTVVAQTSASETTNAGAQLIVPMTLTQNSSLHFGNITLLDATVAGTVTLSTANARTFTGGVSLETGAGSPSSSNATYAVTGTYNETYALSLPTTITVKETESTETMTISDLQVLFNDGAEETGVGATSTLSATGTDDFIVGGTLAVAIAQIGGIYAGTFDVSVDYN